MHSINITITHIKQLHNDPFENGSVVNTPQSQTSRVSVVMSQLQIATTLIARSMSCPVVIEGWGAPPTMSAADIDIQELQHIRDTFPQGIIPSLFKNLTPKQQDMLYEKGSPYILMALGIIPSIHRSIIPNSEACQATKQLFDRYATPSRYELFFPGFYKARNLAINKLNAPREEEAIQCAMESVFFNIASHGYTAGTVQQVFLVYGAAHDFSRYHNTVQSYKNDPELSANITIEVIDCVIAPKNMSTLDATSKHKYLNAAIIGRGLAMGLGLALLFTGIFAPLGAGLLGAGVTLGVGVVVGAILSPVLYSIGKWIYRQFSLFNNEPPAPPAHTEFGTAFLASSSHVDMLHDLTRGQATKQTMIEPKIDRISEIASPSLDTPSFTAYSVPTEESSETVLRFA